jgi:hypothetical protein
MYNLSLSQDPAISRDQLREQIRQQVQQATMQAREAARQAQQAAREAAQAGNIPAPGQPGAPVGTPVIAVRGMPWENDIPPRIKEVSVAFFITMAFIIVGFPLMRAIARRIERGTPAPAQIPPQMQAQMQQLMQSVDAIAIEVERISEGQRFATKMLAEKHQET